MYKEKTALYLFFFLCGIFYIIPHQIQLPFKLILLFLFNIYFIKIKFSFWHNVKLLFLLITVSTFIIHKIYSNVFDPSIIIVFLSIIPVYNFKKIKMNITLSDQKYIKLFLVLTIISLLIQLAFFRYNGRPNLSYEINQSSSYLFLFFLLCQIFKYRLGKIVVLFSSFLLLSRLLILCLLLFYIIKYLKVYIKKKISQISYTFLFMAGNIFLIVFSFWFFVNMATQLVDTTDDYSRITAVNDGSNFLRFKINVNVITSLFENDHDLLYKGYGDLGKNQIYRDEYFIMPHNELIKSLAQFGLILTLLFFFISKKNFSYLTSFSTIEYIIPIIVYTLILWVRFTIVPSLEMIFILYILTFKSNQNET